jgi:hypothetical protein
MKLEMRTPQALEPAEGEIRDLVHPDAPSMRETETDVEIAPLVGKVGATSIAEIDKLMGELRAAKDYLQSEGERIQQETVRYTSLAETASASVKIILETVSEWRKAGHPVRHQARPSAFAFTPAPAEDDNTGEASVADEQSAQPSGPVRVR